MSFVIYDLTFLVLFTLAVVLFLYRKRDNLKRQGVMYLYRTRVGLKIIDWTSTKFGKILKPLQYVVITSGYLLMVVMIWMLVKFTYIYSRFDVVKQLKIPPVLPLFPYATDLFKVDFLPPFYFTYWILIIAIIAVSHEFAHGIFARLNNIKVHSTGFGFLGPFLAAFVEPDEKQMQKASKFKQLSILAAGTFANVIMTILFGIIMTLFFVASFSPAGVNFNAYPQAIVDVGMIASVGGFAVTNLSAIHLEGTNLTTITANNTTYLIPENNLKQAIDLHVAQVVVFENAPAVESGLKGPIMEIDGVPVMSLDELKNEINSHAPGEEITIKAFEDKQIKTYDLKLGDKEGKPYLGVGFRDASPSGISGVIYSAISKIKDPTVYYAPNWNSDFALFIYNFLWWTVMINISVALVNMLPVGIFDGGRFFYLTIWGITGKEKLARKSFSVATYLILAIVVWLMVRWFFGII